MSKKNSMMMGVLAALVLLLGNCANAAGVGYINYAKIQDSYSVAQAAIKEVDAKALELQQYMVDKEKQYKALDTPLKKQNFEEATAREFKAKEQALVTLRTQKEEQVYKKIQAATKQVLVEQKLDAVVDFRVIFVGGVDITDLVIQKLKTGKF